MKCLLDTNCLIALVSVRHQHHADTLAAVEKRAKRKDEFIVAAHSLAEAYSVLTRLPTGHRVPPQVAADTLWDNFGDLKAIVLSQAEQWAAIKSFPENGVAGGRTYDALIAACAARAKADELLTWNTAHFASLIDGINVVSPSVVSRVTGE